jgi:hypothetical protein
VSQLVGQAGARRASPGAPQESERWEAPRFVGAQVLLNYGAFLVRPILRNSGAPDDASVGWPRPRFVGTKPPATPYGQAPFLRAVRRTLEEPDLHSAAPLLIRQPLTGPMGPLAASITAAAIDAQGNIAVSVDPSAQNADPTWYLCVNPAATAPAFTAEGDAIYQAAGYTINWMAFDPGDGTLYALPNGLLSISWVPAGPVPPPVIPPPYNPVPLVKRHQRSHIEWNLDGRSIPMEGPSGQQAWQASMLAQGGFDRASGAVAAKYLRDADQGSLLTAYKPSGEPLYQGKLASPPKVKDAWRKLGTSAKSKDGYAVLEAEGPKVALESQTARRLYQSRDTSIWADQTGSPYSYSQQGKYWSLIQAGGLLRINIPPGTTMAVGDFAGFVFWAQGQALSSIAFTSQDNSSHTPFRIRTATGPSGASGFIADVVTEADQVQALDGNDLVLLLARRSDNPGAVGPNSLAAMNLRVNAIAPGDTFYTSDVIADLAGAVGLDPSGIQSADFNAMPLDWTSGAWSDLAYYIASLDDWRCLILDDRGNGPFVDYGPWVRTYTASLERGATEDLTLLKVYNRVTVPYSTVSGVPQTVTLDAAPDPLGGRAGIVEYIDQEIADAQPDSSIAAAVAANLLARLSTRRVSGPVQIGDLRAADENVSPYELRAGDLLSLPDFFPAIGPQRVAAITYRAGGIVEAAIEADTSAAGLIARLTNRRARARHHVRDRH